MVSSVSEILLKNNLNYPANLSANELNMYLYGLDKISPADNYYTSKRNLKCVIKRLIPINQLIVIFGAP